MITELLKTFEDYEHILLILAGVVVYFRWQKLRKEVAEDQKAAHEEHRKAAAEEIKLALSNGIGNKMKQLIEEHEVREKQNMLDVLERHTELYHSRNRKR